MHLANVEADESGRYRKERQKINRKRDFYPPNSIACVVLFFYLQTNTEAKKGKRRNTHSQKSNKKQALHNSRSFLFFICRKFV